MNLSSTFQKLHEPSGYLQNETDVYAPFDYWGANDYHKGNTMDTICNLHKLSKRGSNETQYRDRRREYFFISYEKGISYYCSQHLMKTWKQREGEARKQN